MVVKEALTTPQVHTQMEGSSFKHQYQKKTVHLDVQDHLLRESFSAQDDREGATATAAVAWQEATIGQRTLLQFLYKSVVARRQQLFDRANKRYFSRFYWHDILLVFNKQPAGNFLSSLFL